jgi:hypothetical protein
MDVRGLVRGRRRVGVSAWTAAAVVAVLASAQPACAYILTKTVVSGGETATNGGSFVLGGTVAEAAAIGFTSGGSYRLTQGFWQPGFQVPTDVAGTPPQTIQYTNAVAQNAPNPFRAGTTITFSVAKTSPVRLVIYDVTGRKVRTLVDEDRGPGRYQEVWDGRDASGTTLASGVYYFRMEIGDWSATHKMLRLH